MNGVPENPVLLRGENFTVKSGNSKPGTGFDCTRYRIYFPQCKPSEWRPYVTKSQPEVPKAHWWHGGGPYNPRSKFWDQYDMREQNKERNERVADGLVQGVVTLVA